ncbi:MAG: hypothetical protein ABSH51_29940 [Solirubrobacteraceae bacterium]
MLEHVQHRPVAEHDLRIEAVDPAARRDRRELLEHPHPDPAPLIIVSDRKGDLGHTGLAQPVVAGDGHHPAVVSADQRQAISAAGLRVRERGCVRPPKAVEAKIAAVTRQAIIESLDVVKIQRRRGLEAHRRSIAQEHVADQRLLGRHDRSRHHSSRRWIAERLIGSAPDSLVPMTLSFANTPAES